MSRRAYPRTPPIGRASISGVSSSFIRHPSPATNSDSARTFRCSGRFGDSTGVRRSGCSASSTAGSLAPRALASYRDAWQALGADAPAKLGTPQMLVYRPPPVAVSRRGYSADTHEEQEVRLRMAVQPTGEIREAIVMNTAPEREAAERAVIAALKRGLWRPGLVEANPVAVSDVEFVERVFVRRPKEK